MTESDLLTSFHAAKSAVCFGTDIDVTLMILQSGADKKVALAKTTSLSFLEPSTHKNNSTGKK